MELSYRQPIISPAGRSCSSRMTGEGFEVLTAKLLWAWMLWLFAQCFVFTSFLRSCFLLNFLLIARVPSPWFRVFFTRIRYVLSVFRALHTRSLTRIRFLHFILICTASKLNFCNVFYPQPFQGPTSFSCV